MQRCSTACDNRRGVTKPLVILSHLCNNTFMNKNEILNKINELEKVLETLCVEDYQSYDEINYELEYLYGQLN